MEGGKLGTPREFFLTNGESAARTWQRMSVKAASILLDHLSKKDDLREFILPHALG